MTKLSVLLLFGFFSLNALATEKSVSFFGGTGLGFGSVRGNEYHGALTGLQYAVDATASYRTRDWVFDGGLGWYFSKLNGQDAAARDIQIHTHGALIELSPRYRV